MKSFVSVLVVVLAIYTAVACGWKNDKQAGMKFVVNKDIIELFKENIIPVGVKAITENLKIPDMNSVVNVPSVGAVNMTLRKMSVNSMSALDSSLRADTNNNLVLTLSDFQLDMGLTWYYNDGKAPVVGTGVGYCDHASGSATFLLGSSGGHPTVKVTACKFDVSDLVFKFRSAPSWFFEAAVNAFHEGVVDAINSGICNVLTGVLQERIDETLSGIPLQTEIDRVFSLDYSLVDPNGLVADPDQFLVANTAGEFYLTDTQPKGLQGEVADMPNNAIGSQYQVFLSEPTVLSLLNTAVEAGVLEGLITKNTFSHFAEAFTTDFVAKYAPGITTKYGKGSEVAIYVVVRKFDDFMFDKKGMMGVRATVEMTVRAMDNSTGSFADAFTLSLKCEADGVIKVDDVKIFGYIDDLSATASLVKSSVGQVNIDGINNLIQLIINFGLEDLNDILRKGTPIPEFSHVKFVNPAIVYGEDYAVVGTDIVFGF